MATRLRFLLLSSTQCDHNYSQAHDVHGHNVGSRTKVTAFSLDNVIAGRAISSDEATTFLLGLDHHGPRDVYRMFQLNQAFLNNNCVACLLLITHSHPGLDRAGALRTHFRSFNSSMIQSATLLRLTKKPSVPSPKRLACTGFASPFVSSGTLHEQNEYLSGDSVQHESGDRIPEQRPLHLVRQYVRRCSTHTVDFRIG